MGLAKVEDLRDLEIGSFYNVACAKMVSEDETIRFVPIIPILHKDPQFGTPGKLMHYHIDGRFIKSSYIAGLYIENGTTNQVICPNHRYPYFQFKEVVRKRRKCVRLTTGLNLNEFKRKEVPQSWAEWYKKMIGKSCKDKICPHFKAKMIEIDGRLVCPVHSLEGCPKTMKIVKPNQVDLQEKNFVEVIMKTVLK